MSNIDYEVRKSVARWCRDVALEDAGTASHAERVKIARKLATNISPRTGEQDTYLPNVIALVRAFTEEGASTAEIDEMVAAIMAVYVALGALQE